MNDAFSRCHPAVNFFFFAGSIGCAMFLTHPVFLGISLLAAAACMACVWLMCRAAGKRLRTGIAVLAAAAGFAAAVVVILLLAQTPTPI